MLLVLFRGGRGARVSFCTSALNSTVSGCVPLHASRRHLPPRKRPHGSMTSSTALLATVCRPKPVIRLTRRRSLHLQAWLGPTAPSSGMGTRCRRRQKNATNPVVNAAARSFRTPPQRIRRRNPTSTSAITAQGRLGGSALAPLRPCMLTSSPRAAVRRRRRRHGAAVKLCDFSKTSMRCKSSANDGLSSGKVRFASPMRLRRNFFVFQSLARFAMKGNSHGRLATS